MRLPDVEINLNPSHQIPRNRNFNPIQKGEDNRYSRPNIHKSKMMIINDNQMINQVNQNSM